MAHLRQASAAALAMALALASFGCGRTPPWVPCEALPDQDVPSLSCADPSCVAGLSTRLLPRSANALLVLDRSCSMAEQIDGRSKWSRAVEAIVSTVAAPGARGVRWGLSLFPDGSPDGVQGPLVVPVQADGGEAIGVLLTLALERDDPNHPQQPGEACFTDLESATHQVAADRVFDDLEGDSYVVLITDGLASEAFESSRDLHQLYESGVPTFVVGFGEGVDSELLERLAQAGGVPASDDVAYYRAGLDDLGDALELVLRGLRCRYRLQLEPEDLPRLTVRFDGGPQIPRDDGSGQGWRYDLGTEELTFLGSACDPLLAGRAGGIDLALTCDDE